MNVGYVYLGEAAGARIVRYGVGFTQVGNSYAFDVRTWEARPFGSDGEGVFRDIVILIRHTAGYNITVVPYVDDVAQPLQTFSGIAPPGGQGVAVARVRAWVQLRGNRLSVQVYTNTLLGDTEFVDVFYSFTPIRMTP